jgi:nitrate/nitrite-specific signal transduction histidine kinase
MEVYEKQFFSSFAEVDEVVKDTLCKLKTLEIKNFEKVEFRINFMLREILNNAVEHGNRFDRTKHVLLKVRYEDYMLYFTVQDEGTGIDTTRHGINDFVLRERNRGYEVIKNFDFEVHLDGNLVEVSLNMKKIR